MSTPPTALDLVNAAAAERAAGAAIKYAAEAAAQYERAKGGK